MFGPLSSQERARVFETFQGQVSRAEMSKQLSKELGRSVKTLQRYFNALRLIEEKKPKLPIMRADWKKTWLPVVDEYTGVSSRVTPKFLADLVRDYDVWKQGQVRDNKAVERKEQQEDGTRRLILIERFRNHVDAMMTLRESIRACLDNSYSDEAEQLGQVFYITQDGLLWRGDKNWSLTPQKWVELCTPDFDDPTPWGRYFEAFRQHLQGYPFWDYLSELHRKAESLAKMYQDTVSQLGPEKVEAWQTVTQTGFRLAGRNPITPIVLQGDSPVYSSDEVTYWFSLFGASVPQMCKLQWEMLKLLKDMNDALMEQTLRDALMAGKCDWCPSLYK